MSRIAFSLAVIVAILGVAVSVAWTGEPGRETPPAAASAEKPAPAAPAAKAAPAAPGPSASRASADKSADPTSAAKSRRRFAMPTPEPSGPGGPEYPPRYSPSGMPPAVRPPSPEPGSPPPSEGRRGPSAPRVAMPAEVVPVVQAGQGPRPHVRRVVRLTSTPAADLARSLGQLLSAEAEARGAGQRLSIAAEPTGNCLVLGGPADAVEEIMRLVAQLDRPAAMVALDVVVADAPAAQAAAAAAPPEGKPAPAAAGQLRVVAWPEKMEVLAHARLSVLDGNAAHLQVSLDEARITGVSQSSAGQMNSISYVSMGTLVQITPRVGPEGVVLMKIDVASSRSGPIEDGMPISVSAAGEVLRTPAVETLSAKASVRVAAGQTIVLAEAAPKPKSAKQRLVFVTPQVLPMSGR